MNSSTAAAAFLRNPLHAFMFWLLLIAVAFPVRVDFPVGPFKTVSALDVALALSALYLLAKFLCMSPIYVGPKTLAISVLAPVFIAVLSTTWAVDIGLSLAAAIKYVYGALIYFVAIQFGKSLPPTGIARVIVAILVAWLIGSLAMYLGVQGFQFFLPTHLSLSQGETLDLFASIYTRLGHPYIGQSNDYGPLLALLAFILLGHARIEGNRLLGAFSGIAFAACVLTFSRGLIVGLLIALCVYAIIGQASVKHILLAGIAAGASVLAAGLAITGFSIALEDRELDLADIVASRLSDVNIYSRLEGYWETLRQIGDRALLGYGVGYYDKSDPASLVAVHNALLEQWKYFGVVLGSLVFFFYIAVMLYYFHQGWRVPQSSLLTSAIACAWLCLLVACMVETFFEATVPRAMIYFLLGLCASQSTTTMSSRNKRNEA